MNVFGRASQRWNKGRKRGVSPIIATILLVAITVVLAAVLYVLISGLVGSTASAPISLAPSVDSSLVGGSSTTNTWYVPVTLTPTASITTTSFALKVQTSTTTVNPGAASGTNCKIGHAYTAGTTCTGTSATWYGVLTAVNGTIMAIYNGSWSASVTISGGSWTVNIVSYTQYDGNGYTLIASGTGSTSVSGQVSL